MIDLTRLVILDQVVSLWRLLRLLQGQDLLCRDSGTDRSSVNKLLSLMILQLKLVKSLLLCLVCGSMILMVIFASTGTGTTLGRRFLAEVFACVEQGTLQLLLSRIKVDRVGWLHQLLLECIHWFAALIESIDVEVGEVGGRLIQIVVKWAAKAAPKTPIAPHVQQLLIELLVSYHLFHGHTSRFSNVK